MVGEISIKGGGLMGQADRNPIAVVQAKFKEVETMFKGWLAKESLPVEAAVVTVTTGAHGAVLGVCVWAVEVSSTVIPPLIFNRGAMPSLKQAQALASGSLVHARNFAMTTGAFAGISCVMSRVRGKTDLETCMAAGFGSGAMYSLVSGMGGPNKAVYAVTSGLVFALFQVGIFQFDQMSSQQAQDEDLNYVKTRFMLSDLGLQNYEKNFKRGLLSDNTLPFLNDSALREVKIPIGPRLCILDHIERNPELKKKRN